MREGGYGEEAAVKFRGACKVGEKHSEENECVCAVCGEPH